MAARESSRYSHTSPVCGSVCRFDCVEIPVSSVAQRGNAPAGSWLLSGDDGRQLYDCVATTLDRIHPSSRDRSAVAWKVNCDVQLTLMASSLYRYLAQRIGQGYETAKSAHIFGDFIDATATLEIDERTIRVHYQKRAHNPLLLAAGLTRRKFASRGPWLGKRLRFIFG